eukprot:EG_transcript_12926
MSTTAVRDTPNPPPAANATSQFMASSLSWTSPGRKVRRDLAVNRESFEMGASGAWAQSVDSPAAKHKKGWREAKADYLQKHPAEMLNDAVYRELIEQKWRVFRRRQLQRVKGGRTTREVAKAEFAIHNKAFQQRQEVFHRAEAEQPAFEEYLVAHPEVRERMERQAVILRRGRARYHVTGEEENAHDTSSHPDGTNVMRDTDLFRFNDFNMSEFRRSFLEAVGGQPSVHFVDFMRAMVAHGVRKKNAIINLWYMVDPADRTTATPAEICSRFQVLLNAKRDRVLRQAYQRLHHRRIPPVDEAGRPLFASSPVKQVPVLQVLGTDGAGAPRCTAGAMAFRQFLRALRRPEAVCAAWGCLMHCLLTVVTEDGERPLFERPDMDDGETYSLLARVATTGSDDVPLPSAQRRATRVSGKSG